MMKQPKREERRKEKKKDKTVQAPKGRGKKKRWVLFSHFRNKREKEEIPSLTAE